MSLNLGIERIAEKLSQREKDLDVVLSESRKIVRSCSNAIKAMHAHDLKAARAHLDEADSVLKTMSSYTESFPAQLNHVYQEYAEARIVLCAIEERRIPSLEELKVPDLPYLTGLLDAIGELKREMYESLRKGKREDAEKYFDMMEQVYDELLPLRFSNSVLPEFRKKQDSARHQIEQARGELL
jgi:translin